LNYTRTNRLESIHINKVSEKLIRCSVLSIIFWCNIYSRCQIKRTFNNRQFIDFNNIMGG